MTTTELQQPQHVTEADFELAFVDLVRASWARPDVIIAFKEAVAAAKGEI
jgi:hypothetical protein